MNACACACVRARVRARVSTSASTVGSMRAWCNVGDRHARRADGAEPFAAVDPGHVPQSECSVARRAPQFMLELSLARLSTPDVPIGYRCVPYVKPTGKRNSEYFTASGRGHIGTHASAPQRTKRRRKRAASYPLGRARIAWRKGSPTDDLRVRRDSLREPLRFQPPTQPEPSGSRAHTWHAMHSLCATRRRAPCVPRATYPRRAHAILDWTSIGPRRQLG